VALEICFTEKLNFVFENSKSEDKGDFEISNYFDIEENNKENSSGFRSKNFYASGGPLHYILPIIKAQFRKASQLDILQNLMHIVIYMTILKEHIYSHRHVICKIMENGISIKLVQVGIKDIKSAIQDWPAE